MFEKVNPSHPDKVADRIAGAIVDYCYTLEENPKIAVEVLIGHNECFIITESSCQIETHKVREMVHRIAGTKDIECHFNCNQQDPHLAENQEKDFRCGDNGIFKGVPVSGEEKALTRKVEELYKKYECDGKYIIDDSTIIACQSNVDSKQLSNDIFKYDGIFDVIVNPLGFWTGGLDVDSGATNRKVGSDMGRGVTGGGLHGKDLSKADVSLNIVAHLLAQEYDADIYCKCAIGDEMVVFHTMDYYKTLIWSYEKCVKTARGYIDSLGGFEKFAEWGLIR